jgi:hypothetical protein
MEKFLEVFANSCDWFVYKLLATPRIQRSSDADAADESSVSLYGNQQEGDEFFYRHWPHLLGSFQTRVRCLNVDGVLMSKSQKKENVCRQKSCNAWSISDVKMKAQEARFWPMTPQKSPPSPDPTTKKVRCSVETRVGPSENPLSFTAQRGFPQH